MTTKAEQASFEAYKRFQGKPNLTREQYEKNLAESIIKITELHRRWRASGDAALIRRLDNQEWVRALMNKEFSGTFEEFMANKK